MPRSSHRAHVAARVAALTRSRTDTDPELIEARRSLAAAGLIEYAQKLVATWPPLTDEQIDTVVTTLRAGNRQPVGGAA